MTQDSSARFNNIASNYVTSEVHAQSPTIEWVHASLGVLPPGSAVCDVACGAGHFGLSFAGEAGRLVAVDPSGNMLACARQLAESRGISLETVQATAESIPLEDESFDLVITRLAAHHFHGIDVAVTEMARLVKPGCRVCIIDLQGFEDPALDKINHRLELLHDPTHVRSYTATQWKGFVERAGLTVEHLVIDQTERPEGVPVNRWCEIANTGPEAEREIMEMLTALPLATLEGLGIRKVGDSFHMPIRTLILVAHKPLGSVACEGEGR